MKLKRIQQVENYIQQQGSISLDELCSVFNVSKNTIRRDVNELEKRGTLRKVYGGVVAVENTLVPYENRTIRYQEEKEKIATIASTLIEENDLIFIDSGTTTSQLLHAVSPELHFTVLTNSLDVVNLVASMENIQLILIGNSYKAKTRSFVGVEDEELITKYNIGKAFMAATGVSISNGLTNSDLLEYRIKKMIVEKASSVYLLADGSKFNKSTLLTYAPLEKVDAIITTPDIPMDYRTFCQEHQITLFTTT
ncbi:DeoR/GlpR family DNA-binding transcription regulator [Carnobacterium divergens]|uniref:DeoR/GlpR family DNA-binding transcription regulator n=1 Tax=Carnobacterium divergens TaxID=2748 RepID=UPI001071A9B0|nr:DeoR/GlpR family DNA-binding transcription regulator [Carnobacterium divergens]TFI74568.1 DeoR family transcriptional regulator [Carnobacterium divergens]TFJ46717.1 DeoR family transcriptional regulator [Carnobacterium divergens]TFJ53681.1 DeoR family transcriptional regulator [Carnobacterium divergens]